ncbi:MAG: winged helix-turn-helix transcriptional regulator [Chitinophagales bacterium]|nr:winged helix-turn-helix transcriptional regulator [Chitinophagales bacterium]
MENYRLDKTDKAILNILMHDSRESYASIAKKLFVSSGTVHVRVKKMEKNGIIKGSQVLVDHNNLHYDITAFLGIYLTSSDLYDGVIAEMKKIPEVVGAHYTTGNYGIFAKIVCKDTDDLRRVLHDHLQKIEGIQRSETFISLEEAINRPILLEE